jgi:Na+-transporting NADH:ubiquinone oxidoreductase subunit A
MRANAQGTDSGTRLAAQLRGRVPRTPGTMRHIHIRKGLDLQVEGAPLPALHPASPSEAVGVLGHDYSPLRPRLRVAEGERVRLGQVLFEDRTAAEIVVTSPAAGVVTRIERGDRRALRAIEICCEGDEAVGFPHYPVDALAGLTRAEVVHGLQQAGLWIALRERPFGHVPKPDATPDALFVTAMDTRPLAPSVDLVLADALPDFRAGLRVLRHLTTGPAYVCTHADGDLPLDPLPEMEVVTFSGPHPAGLAGTHIHRLAPVEAGRSAWHIGYQDVIAVGRLFQTGRLDASRIVALGGPGVERPRHVRSRLGAALPDLLAGELAGGPQRIISGSLLGGRRMEDGCAFLGRYDDQVTVLPEGDTGVQGTTTSAHGRRTNMLPLRGYERLSPLDLLVVPLLRALLAGDVETARALGCLELIEEDLSLLTYGCPSKQDYGPLLRAVLDRIEGGA